MWSTVSSKRIMAKMWTEILLPKVNHWVTDLPIIKDDSYNPDHGHHWSFSHNALLFYLLTLTVTFLYVCVHG